MKHEADTRYFDNYEEEEPWWIPENDTNRKVKLTEDNYEDFLFHDFTLKKEVEKEKSEYIENYFNRLQKMAMNNKNSYSKKKKPVLVNSDSLVSFTDEKSSMKISKKDINNLLVKPVKNKLTSCVKRSRLNTDASDKSLVTGKSGLTKPNSSKVLPKNKIELRPASKVSKKKDQLFINGINNKFFNTCALQQRKTKNKVSPKTSKNAVEKQKTSKDTTKPAFNYNFRSLKPDASTEKLCQKLKSPKSNKFFAKLKEQEASVKNKFVINIKNFQSPQKQPNFLLDFMNTNIYGKTKLNVSSSPHRVEIQSPLLQPSFYKLKVPHGKKGTSPEPKESIDTKVFKHK